VPWPHAFLKLADDLIGDTLIDICLHCLSFLWLEGMYARLELISQHLARGLAVITGPPRRVRSQWRRPGKANGK
jgi:hypothetical protein